MAFVGVLLAFAWPVVQNGISALAVVVNNSGAFGTFLYGLIERSLVPFGLHHVFYTPFWYGSFVEANLIINGVETVVQGANTAYFVQLGSMGDLVGASSETMANIVTNTTRFMAGKFPFMMFGLPGAALAMYKCAKPEKRKAVGGLVGAAALTALLTGITEPLEFTFLFVAPALFAVHAVFAGISFMLMDIFSVFIGQTFSGGLIDFVLFGLLPAGAGVATRWYVVILVGIVYFIVYYFLFSFLIKKFNLKTPGREDEDEEIKLFSKKEFQESKGIAVTEQVAEEGEDHWKTIAPLVLEALGGEENIDNLDACITRLRVEVKETAKVNKERLKELGAAGVMEVRGGVQAIYGGNSNTLKNHILDIIGE